MDRRRLLLVVAAVVAALGVALVFVYARGAETRAADKFDTVEVLTAAQQIEPGESLDEALESGKVQLTNVARAQLLEGADDDSKPLRDKVALTTIYPGEQLIPLKFGAVEDVQAASVLPIPEGKIAISVLVKDDGRVGRFIKTGAEVSIIATIIESNKPILTRMLLPRVTVLADGLKTFVPEEDTSGEVDGNDQEIQRLVTLALSQREAEKIRFAEKDGELTIALLNDASTVKVGPQVDRENLFD
ncbi:Flp pilus assembly protein CpaB [Nocardioides sp. Root190]|uniref:Flp pilus assembly protein CpaB n=1 Tax=Nocardioides sp. Root190 TaxID=1736488 RepID=UPI0009ECC18D|nr:Flp pilus assembly protein CpaB [Nocardioides sp. Root190]